MIFYVRWPLIHHQPRSIFTLRKHTLPAATKKPHRQSLDRAKVLGLTQNSLHVLEQQNYQNVFDALESP